MFGLRASASRAELSFFPLSLSLYLSLFSFPSSFRLHRAFILSLYPAYYPARFISFEPYFRGSLSPRLETPHTIDCDGSRCGITYSQSVAFAAIKLSLYTAPFILGELYHPKDQDLSRSISAPTIFPPCFAAEVAAAAFLNGFAKRRTMLLPSFRVSARL